mgnify:CR=1 FL=1
MRYLFKLSTGESFRREEELVERVRQLSSSNKLSDVALHVYEGRKVGRRHMGQVAARNVLLAKGFNPEWLK